MKGVAAVSGRGMALGLVVSGPALTELRSLEAVQRTAITTSRVSTPQWENQRTEGAERIGRKPVWEAGMINEVFLGTETFKVRPGGLGGGGQGKGPELEKAASLSQVKSKDEDEGEGGLQGA